jgi:Bacterial Ig-like domain (group 2)
MVELVNGQSVDLSVAYTDAQGAPAPAPGPVNWYSSDTSIVTVSSGTEDESATATSVAEGTATITAESNGITCGLDMIVGASEAVASEGTITAGEPYDTTGAPDQGLPPPAGRLPGQLPGTQRPPAQQAPAQTILRTTTIRR